MARNFDTVSQIDREKDIWRVIVRVTDVWQIVNTRNETHLEMVVMDAKGDKIQAIVPKEETPKWINRVREEMTLIRELDSDEVPHDEFKFKDFGDILNGKFRGDLLIDAIGAVHEIVYSKSNATQKMVSLRLMDLSGNILGCTLWDDYASRFLASYQERGSTTEPFIVVIKYARIRPTDGTYPVSLSNSYNYSKLFLNEEIQPIQQFKERLTPEEFLQLATQSQSQLTGGTQFSDLDRFKYKAPAISLTNIKQLYQNTPCTTVCTTGRIVVNKRDWSYQGCGICRKAAKPVGDLFVCDDGHQNKAAVPRYRVLVRCKDNSGTEYNFLFWDQDSEQMIQCSAVDLMNKMIAEGEDDPMSYPADLDDILGRTMAVRCKVEPRNRQASVVRYSERKDFIENIIDEIATAENTSQDVNCLGLGSENLTMEMTSSQYDKGKSSISGDLATHTESVSATADHDPDSVATLTPAKRLNDDSYSIDLMSPENLSAKFSSTTKPVTVKTEKP